MKIKNSLKLSFLLLFLVSYSYAASSKIGTTAVQFLKLGIGAENAAMGNIGVSNTQNGNAIYWNPANIENLTKKEFSFSHTIWFEDINYEWLSFVLPTAQAGNFGIAAQYVSYGSIDKVDISGTKNGSFSPTDLAIYLSYSNHYKNFMFGGNLKYINTTIENSASAFALDFGTTYQIDSKTSLGFAFSNLGTKIKFNNEEEELPLIFKIGGSHNIIDNLLLAVDLSFPNDNDLYINFGGQYLILLGDMFDLKLRAGYDGRNKDIPGFNWLNFGFGIGFNDLSFDYAFVPCGDIGMTHRFSFSIKFGNDTNDVSVIKNKEEKKKAKDEQKKLKRAKFLNKKGGRRINEDRINPTKKYTNWR